MFLLRFSSPLSSRSRCASLRWLHVCLHLPVLIHGPSPKKAGVFSLAMPTLMRSPCSMTNYPAVREGELLEAFRETVRACQNRRRPGASADGLCQGRSSLSCSSGECVFRETGGQLWMEPHGLEKQIRECSRVLTERGLRKIPRGKPGRRHRAVGKGPSL